MFLIEFLRKRRHYVATKMKVQVVMCVMKGERKQNPNDNTVTSTDSHWIDVEWLPRMGEMISFTTVSERGNRMTQYGEVLNVIHNYDGRFVRMFVLRR